MYNGIEDLFPFRRRSSRHLQSRHQSVILGSESTRFPRGRSLRQRRVRHLRALVVASPLHASRSQTPLVAAGSHRPSSASPDGPPSTAYGSAQFSSLGHSTESVRTLPRQVKGRARGCHGRARLFLLFGTSGPCCGSPVVPSSAAPPSSTLAMIQAAACRGVGARSWARA